MDPDLERRIAAARRGDSEAIGALIERYHEELLRYVARHAGSLVLQRESEADLVQSACREVLQDLPRIELQGGAAGFKAWLFRTALRKIVDRQRYYRRKKRDVGREIDMPLQGSRALDFERLMQLQTRLLSPSELAGRQEDLGRLAAAIDELPEAQRDALVLSYFDGLSHREIAARIDRTEVAVRSLVSRALARLAREILGHPPAAS